MPDLDRRTLLYFFGIASVTPLLRAQTPATGKVLRSQARKKAASPSRLPKQAKLSPCKLILGGSGGSCTAFELSAMPQTGPYQHVHHREDELVYYVLSGEFLFKAGGEEHTLPVGASIWLPKGIPHVWANAQSVLRRAS